MRNLPSGRRSIRRMLPSVATLLLIALFLVLRLDEGAGLDAAEERGFTNFETEPVRPIALSPDGALLYVLNTADDRLEVWDNHPAGPRRIGEVVVGLRPVALTPNGAREVWVSNHLGDSVSVVDASDPTAPVLRHSLPVGDEPRDIVRAGDRIFVATARRSATLASGEGQAEIWVFEAADPTAGPKRIPLFGTKPRALAVSPDGRRVYAGIYRSGNRTTTVDERVVNDRITPTPSESELPAPRIGRILRQEDDGAWLDYEGRDWSDEIGFRLPDDDVWILDAVATTPRVIGSVRGVGTVLFNLAVQPGSGEIWVSNTESRNDIRFEPGLRGRAVESRISRLMPDGEDRFRPHAVNLNPQLVTGTPTSMASPTPGVTFVPTSNPGLAQNKGAASGEGRSSPAQATETPTIEATARSTAEPSEMPSQEPTATATARPSLNELGLSQATDIVFSADGRRAWAAVFGSNRVVELDSAARVVARHTVGAGPGGLALDERQGRLFVLNRLDLSLSQIDLVSGAVETYPLAHDPRPEFVQAGQPFLYDASVSSENGSQSCASCHVFGDMDLVAWDLGVPGGDIQRMPFDLTHENFVLKPRDFWFHPEKGPMMTQSLRGMAGTGPLHWRGDRFGGEGDPEGELGDFSRFRPAFRDLLGREEMISEEDMTAFGRFVFGVRYPPNPLQRPDRQLQPVEAQGAALFSGDFEIDSGVTNCEGCHSLPLGTNGKINFEGDRSGQDFKAPHLRNLYEKLGRLDQADEVISGYGFGHDGSVDTLLAVLETELFTFPGDQNRRPDVGQRLEVVHYLMAFDTGMAPMVGRQLSLDAASPPETRRSLDLVMERARAGDCDLVARARVAGIETAWLYQGQRFQEDRVDQPAVGVDDLVARLSQDLSTLSFLCVPPGDGQRSALDRDLDGHWDGDERQAGSDPADPDSQPDPRFVYHIYLPRAVDMAP